MSRDEYLNLLRQRLAEEEIPGAEQMVSFYAEMIDDRMEDGLPEEEAVASMETVEAVVEQAKLDRPITALVTSKMKESHEQAKKSGRGGLWLALVILGFPVWFPLLVAFFVVVLALCIVLWAVIISLFAVNISLGVAAAACFIGAFSVLIGWIPAGTAVAAVGCALILAGLCTLLWSPVVALAKAIMRLMGTMLRKVKGIFVK